MATPPDFATIQDLENYWRALDSDENSRASSLISLASNYLRQIARNNGIDLDVRLADQTDTIFAGSLRLVVLSAVKRAMLTPSDAPPVDTWSQSASPYSETMKFTNPSNDLFFKKSELQMLNLGSLSGKSQFGVLRGVR